MIDALHNELALLPLSKLNAALQLVGQSMTDSKSDAVRFVAAEVLAGKVTIDHIKALDKVDKPTVDADLSGIDSMIERAERTAEDAVALGERAIDKIDQVSSLIDTRITTIVRDLSFKIDSTKVVLENKIDAFEPTDFGGLIAAEVAKVFEPFKQSATEEKLVEIAAQVPIS